MPAQQKAFVLPAKQAAPVLQDIDVPTPGPGELLVKVEAAALNPIDWKLHLYDLIKTYPVILGSEGAGTVQAVGDGVKALAKGDRV